jgi:hypothetical protein
MKKVIKLTESDLTRIVKRVIKENEDLTQPLKGQLNYESFGDDEMWYVTFPKLGHIRLSSKLEDKLDPLLKDLEYQNSMWEISVWDHTQTDPYSRYKVTKYIK